MPSKQIFSDYFHGFIYSIYIVITPQRHFKQSILKNTKTYENKSILFFTWIIYILQCVTCLIQKVLGTEN